MKLWSTEHVFSHPWKKVTEAAWKKYPNEQNTNVKAIDVIDRKITEDGKLLTTRIFGSTWNLPTFITTLLGMPEMCYAVESSEVDLINEKMTLKMINYTFWGILAVEEKLVYEPHKENPNETSLTQGAKISVNGIQFSNYFEDVIVNNFESTSSRGRQALEQVLHKIKIENMLTAITNEIQELSSDIDRTTSVIDSEFCISERLHELIADFDQLTATVNSEFQILSSILSTEFTNLLTTVESELNQISVRVSSSCSPMNGETDNVNKGLGITAAVKNSGISVKLN